MNIDTMKQNAASASRLMRIMANEKRLLILCQLIDGERSVSELAESLDIRQSTVSQHLSLLRSDRLVRARRSAQTQYYSLAGTKARALISTLYGLYCAPDRGVDGRRMRERAS